VNFQVGIIQDHYHTISTAALVVVHPQVEAMEMIVPVPHARGGDIQLVGNPIHLSQTPEAQRRSYSSPPLLGQHTEEVLSSVLDLPSERIQELREAEVIA